MREKELRNELLAVLADVKQISESLEFLYQNKHKEATDVADQLLKAYEIKVEVLKALKNI